MPDNKPKPKKTQLALTIGLGASLLLNAALGFSMMTNNTPSENATNEDGTPNVSFYEDRVAQLESENALLQDDLDKAQTSASSSTSESSSESSSSSEKADPATADYQAVKDVTTSYLETYLTMDTGSDTNEARREAIAPFTSEEMLDKVAPTPSQLSDMGIEPAHDHGPQEDPAEDASPYTNYVYEQGVESITIYVNADNIKDGEAVVLADVVTNITDNMDADYDVLSRYNLTLVKEDDTWVIDDQTVDATEDADPE